MAFLTQGLPLLAEEEGIVDPRFLRSAESASTAVSRHQVHLETELRRRESDRYACGEEALERYLRLGHFIDLSPDELADYAEDERARAESALAAGARRLGASSAEDVLAALTDLHPTVEAYYDRYGETWSRCRRIAESRGLLTWPELPIRYVPRPGWCRAAAPDLYFLFYRSPAAFDRPDE